ncbi:50S ribosomal protein L30 [Lujinxingia litoralis]|uniref:50S ribosomal protein L30 n=1 Tax=Lujinxingia litoralis TaxID=2211119 RepID=A0A328CDI7_9DELT|nr:50S ribosomal protein L30 [Lujinxingia litoralis]RAL25029.1 50S ribosomal protein L30 [Lujinxingia litoralis]
MAQLKVTLLRGLAGKTERQRANIHSLGLRKIRDSVVVEDHPTTRGQIAKVQHLVTVETIEE